jgi:hypothetical protein
MLGKIEEILMVSDKIISFHKKEFTGMEYYW